jgi:hypothetical protein
MPGGRRARHVRQTQGRRWFNRTHVVRVLAIASAAVVLVGIATVAAVVSFHLSPWPSSKPSPAQPPAHPSVPSVPSVSSAPPQAAPTDLNADFTRLEAGLHAKVGAVISAVGDGQQPVILGDWQEGPAWSTIKVPLVIAAYRQADPPQVSDAMRAAIVESDNAAAEKVWAQLGDPATAAGRVEQILQETGDQTIVESQKVRPEFTAFGQTKWPLVNQVRFTASAVCNSANDPIFNLMGQIQSNQSWGLGHIHGTQFKGGWGPSTSGKYLVRQIGVLTTPAGKIAVAIAAEPASGSFDDGTHDLDEVTTWLSQHLGALPVGQCGR